MSFSKSAVSLGVIPDGLPRADLAACPRPLTAAGSPGVG